VPVNFTCPACGRELAAPDGALGVAGHCRFCGAAIISPSIEGGEARLQPSDARDEPTFTEVRGAVPGAYAEGGPPPGGPYVHPPTGELDLGAIISEAWSTVTSNWGIFVAAAIVTHLLPSVVQQVVQLPMQLLSPALERDQRAAGVLIAVASMLAAMAVSIAAVPLYWGLSYLTRHLWVRGTLEFTAIFSGYRRFWTFVFIPLLQGLLMLPFAAPFIIAIAVTMAASDGGDPSPAGIAVMIVTGLFFAGGAIYVGLCTMLAPLEVVDRGSGAVEAIKASWEATRGHRLMLFAINVVLSLLQLAGLLACCVGILITTPTMSVAQMIVYRSLRGITGTEY
jgi:ribosomal protein S27E